MSEIERELSERGGVEPSDTLEVLDSNIVILLEEPLTQIANPLSLFEGSELTSFMKKPLTPSQGINLDLASGATVGTLQIESMKSQKTISLSPVRIEVHDRSGNRDPESTQIPETMVALANALHIHRVKAIGANWEVMLTLQEGVLASKEVAEKLLQQGTSFLPQNMELIGGTARMFLSGSSGVVYTLAIEPRLQNPQTNELWMTCNANHPSLEALSIELLKEMFRQSYQLLFKVQESLFPASEL
jgi:hypothetical protein